MDAAITSKAAGTESFGIAFRCPWGCGTSPSTAAHQVYSGSPGWAVAKCGYCKRWTLFRIVLANGITLEMVETGRGATFVERVEMFPVARPSYDEETVPEAIRNDYREALRCAASGFYIGAALVGRRALQTAVRERTPADVKAAQATRLTENNRRFLNLEEEIDDLPDEVLGKIHRDAAHGVRYIGNDAAHSDPVSADDAQELLNFTSEILRQLYVFPAEVKDNQARRAAKKKPPAKS